MKYFITIALIIFISSCVSETEYDNVVSENTELKSENNSLSKELNEIKFGAPNLLKDAIAFYESGDYKIAKEKLDMLLLKHPNKSESAEGGVLLKQVNAEITWKAALDENSTTSFEDYISSNPDGKYITEARKNIKQLKAERMDEAYTNAVNRNSSMAWKDFISDYPNHPEVSSIKRKIIKLEVDEIIADDETGEMPSFSRTNYEYSSTSKISIRNDTGCELVVRYSGDDVKSVSIPKNQSRTVYLSSGNYRVAASACGKNYGATETLGGNYSSSFYIRTTTNSYYR